MVKENIEQTANEGTSSADPMKTFVPFFMYPTHSNDECLAGIVEGNKEREKNEVYVERRDPRQLRATLENIQTAEAGLKRELDVVARKMAAITKEISQLRKLEKKYAKYAANRFATDAYKEVQEKLAAAEKILANLKFRESGLTSTIRGATQGVKDFLAGTPRKGVLSNKEYLAEFEEAELLEMELHRDKRRASW
jgi:chromosome segregation ATPase